nr:2,3-bisphosphoglycerate-dependent phosphoglycerate mutase [Candidatus Pantoea persica]
MLHNAGGMVATFMDWGATWLSARVPMADGSVREALLGCAMPSDYLHQDAYLSATVGHYANRIARAILTQQAIQLAANQGEHQLHGGPQGFDKHCWQIVSQSENRVMYRLDSPDDDNCLSISYQAEVDRPCPVNLTNHAYFNLDVHHGDARQHRLQMLAEQYLPVDSCGIPSAPLKAVAGTSFDFRAAKTVAQDFLANADQQAVKGYDHAFLLDADGDVSQPAAHLWSVDGMLQLTVTAAAPALQFYTGNYLAGTRARE